jgi:hypothetical protein
LLGKFLPRLRNIRKILGKVLHPGNRLFFFRKRKPAVTAAKFCLSLPFYPVVRNILSTTDAIFGIFHNIG